MPTPHELAIKQALKTNDQIGRAIAALGTADHPRGALLTGYANTRRALTGNTGNPLAVREVLTQLRANVFTAIHFTMGTAADIGLTAGQRNLEIYGLPPVIGFNIRLKELEQAAVTAVMTMLDNQIAAIQAMVNAKMASEGEILGDENRVGMLTPAPVQRQAANWVASVVSGSFLFIVTQAVDRESGQVVSVPGRAVYLKQAIAAIDERTTECCLEVNGQTQPLDQPFILIGEPRYADEQMEPPFHNYCRTATALVREADSEDESTQEMVEAAQAELTAREETGTVEEIHPASSVSRR